jgi:hypothetical protein
MAEVTITVQPGWEAALAGLAAVVAIDVAAIKWKRWTISRLIRHLRREHPIPTLVAAVALGLHLTFEFRGDPAIRFARWMGQGDA